MKNYECAVRRGTAIFGRGAKMKRVLTAGVVGLFACSTVFGAVMRKGPYLIYPGKNSEMTVLWQLDSAQTCRIEWGTDASCSDGNAVTAEYNSSHQHKYTIAGLAAGVKHYYRVNVGVNGYGGSFRTAPEAGAHEVKILGYGDTRTNFLDHDAVDGAMVGVFEADPAYQTFTMLSGDWVANGEVESDWTNDFFNPAALNTRKLQANLPINGCIGNHEWESGRTPPTYFDKYWPYPYVDGFYWSFDYGPVHVTVVDQYGRDYKPGSAQYNWLVQDLASTEKEWKILQFHEPGYSAGGGHSDNTNVQTYIQPLCEQYAVDMVFAGHNHYYARCDKNGVKHITAGGGGAPLRAPEPHYSPYVEVVAGVYHYCKIDIRGNELFFEAVQPDGTVVDSLTLSHPKVELTGPQEGERVGAGGAVLSCNAVGGAVGYQLFFSGDPNRRDYLVCDSCSVPNVVITTFPYEQTWWSISVRMENGRTLYSKAGHVTAENVIPVVILNQTKGKTYQNIQRAVDEAGNGDEIVIGPSPWSHAGNVDIRGKSVKLSSTNPHDPAIAASTVINGIGRPVLSLTSCPAPGVTVEGLTITGGMDGVLCRGGNLNLNHCMISGNTGCGLNLSGYTSINIATIVNCRFLNNGGTGIYCSRSTFMVDNCEVLNNGGEGIESDEGRPRWVKNSLIAGNALNGVKTKLLFAILMNCTVVGNGAAGVKGDSLRTSGSIIRQNLRGEIVVPYNLSNVQYSNIGGGWSGTGNIDADPCFVSAGYWDADNHWVNGDYHLRAASACVNAGDPNYVPVANETDLDGDPRILYGRLDIGADEFLMPPVQCRMHFTPQTLNPRSEGRWVKAHLVLPQDFGAEDVNTNTAAVLEPFHIESDYINVFVNDEGFTELEIGFDRSGFCGREPFEGVVTVSGALQGWQRYEGSDEIRILSKLLRCAADVAGKWLESNCKNPLWCDGADLDQSQRVDFADFALTSRCCIEIAFIGH